MSAPRTLEQRTAELEACQGAPLTLEQRVAELEACQAARDAFGLRYFEYFRARREWLGIKDPPPDLDPYPAQLSLLPEEPAASPRQMRQETLELPPGAPAAPAAAGDRA